MQTTKFAPKYVKGIPTKSSKEVDLAAEKLFTAMRRKYASAISFLLRSNIYANDLSSYFNRNEENRERYEKIKLFRSSMLSLRPKCAQWIDSAFYLELKLGGLAAEGVEVPAILLSLGGCEFKCPLVVVKDKYQLEQYLKKISSIIINDDIWDDDDMAGFALVDVIPPSSSPVEEAEVADEDVL